MTRRSVKVATAKDVRYAANWLRTIRLSIRSDDKIENKAERRAELWDVSSRLYELARQLPKITRAYREPSL